MDKNSNIRKLGEVLDSYGRKHVKVQTAWATVKSVNWDNKTMVATGVADELDYEGVLLGTGFIYLKPKLKTLCLLGMVENNDAAAFLIDAEEVEEMDIKTSVKVNLNANELVINGGDNDGLVLLHKLESNLNKLKDYVETMKMSVITGLNSVGAGSAANGSTGATAFNSSMISQQIAFENMENNKVKQ